MKKTLIVLLLSFFVAFLFANPPMPRHEKFESRRDYRNFHGKRFVDRDKDFKPVIVKFLEIPEEFIIEVVFNSPIAPESIQCKCIMINDVSIDSPYLLFSKRRNAFRFTVPKEIIESRDNGLSLNISGIRSVNGTLMKPVEFKDCVFISEYRFFEREKEWKKSLL